MQSCQAFQRKGAEVTLVVPHRMQPKVMRDVADPFQYYGLRTQFRIDRLPCVDSLEVAPGPLQPAAFALQATTFTLAAAVYLSFHQEDLYYTRDPLTAALMALAPGSARARVAYEAHTFPKPGAKRGLHLWAVKRLGRLVCITRGLAEEYVACGIDPRKIVVAPDAVDLERFAQLPDKDAARQKLGMPVDARIACYTGHLYEWKGARTLALASRFLPDEYLVYVVGGTAEDLASFRRFLEAERLDRVRVVGHVPPDQVPSYLAAADVLVLPNSARSETSARFTSPMKLFEYMAAGRPTVASDLPSIREVLRDEENALLVKPDDPESLARGIVALAGDEPLARRLAEAARIDVLGHTWDARAEAILSSLRADDRLLMRAR
jgi:glycosyltransferase involved in cell wall biosynthesis